VSDEDGDDDLGSFADFDKQIERAVGVPVLWDDREIFVISRPKPDTLERIRGFIQNYRKSEGK
jgi:hypothetical protein